MARIHCLQQWFGLSDLDAEEALLETDFYRKFVGISGQRIPARVSMLRFRHLLEEHDLSPKNRAIRVGATSPITSRRIGRNFRASAPIGRCG